jgi:hypothetical protein
VNRNKLEIEIDLIRARQERNLGKWFAVIGVALAVGEVIMSINFTVFGISIKIDTFEDYILKLSVIVLSAIISWLVYKVFER